jgi:hypothetical protein
VTITIAIETDTDLRPSAMFRLIINGKVVATELAGPQAHLVVGELLQRMASVGETKDPARPERSGTRAALPPATQFPLPD